MKEEYQKKVDAQMKEWNAELELLKAKAENVEASAKVSYTEHIEKIQQKKEEASRKLEELKNSGEDAWADIKVGVEFACADLKRSFESALLHFQK